MPWYDFRCEQCGHAFELRLPVAQRDQASCPRCGGVRVRRAMPLSLTVVGAGKSRTQPECACGREGGCPCQEEGGR